MIELLGYVAALVLMLSGVPIAIRTWRDGNTSISLVGTLCVLVGSAGMFVYEANTGRSVPQLIDFAVVFLTWAVVARYRLFPRDGRQGIDWKEEAEFWEQACRVQQDRNLELSDHIAELRSDLMEVEEELDDCHEKLNSVSTADTAQN